MKNRLRIVGILASVGCTAIGGQGGGTARHLHDRQFRKWPVPRTECATCSRWTLQSSAQIQSDDPVQTPEYAPPRGIEPIRHEPSD
jgi:hypothetical protein